MLCPTKTVWSRMTPNCIETAMARSHSTRETNYAGQCSCHGDGSKRSSLYCVCTLPQHAHFCNAGHREHENSLHHAVTPTAANVARHKLSFCHQLYGLKACNCFAVFWGFFFSSSKVRYFKSKNNSPLKQDSS